MFNDSSGLRKRICGLLVAMALTVAMHTPFADDTDGNLRLWQRDYLFGDWHGFRTGLEEKGLSFELVYTSEYFWNVSGGISHGSDYRADLSLMLDLDTEKAGWWNNGEFFALIQGQHGDGITEEHVGDFQFLSNIDADDFFQVSEIWYKHTFLDGKLWLKLGKLEGNEDFAFVDYGVEFLNVSPGFSPTIPLTSVPDSDWGVVLGAEPTDWFSMNVGLYQGRPDGGRSPFTSFDDFFGPFVIVEPTFHYTIRERPGHLRLGFWWNGDRFEELSPEEGPSVSAMNGLELLGSIRELGLVPTFLTALTGGISESITEQITAAIVGEPSGGTRNDTHGFYVNWEQELWKEHPDDEEDEQGIGLFAQYGWAEEEVIEAKQYFGLGFSWTGAIPSRDEDMLGLGVFHTDFSDQAGFGKANETTIELFYRAQIAPWASVKPDLQYIFNPGGSTNGDAFVLGLRTEISF